MPPAQRATHYRLQIGHCLRRHYGLLGESYTCFITEMMEEQTLVKYLESPDFLRASTNATRLVTKLKTAIQRQELYETHQILRTIYFRFINVQEKLEALENLLFLGACFLLANHEEVSGQDIGVLFLESAAKLLQIHRDGGTEVVRSNLTNTSLVQHSQSQSIDHDIALKAATLAAKLPDSEIGLGKFVAEMLRLLTQKLINRSLLHETLAREFWRQTDYANSRYHFLHCANLENSEDVAKLLVEYHTKNASESEVDLFITQFILQFLCLQSPLDTGRIPNQKNNPVTPPSCTVGRKTRANIKAIVVKIFFNYTSKHPRLSQVCIPFSSLPLLNFTYFIISILDAQGEAAAFRMLCDIYRVTWCRDPNYRGYLTRIGTLYFGIIDQASQQRQGGFFNNILLSLLEGTDEEDEDESTPDRNNFSSCDELD